MSVRATLYPETQSVASFGETSWRTVPGVLKTPETIIRIQGGWSGKVDPVPTLPTPALA